MSKPKFIPAVLSFLVFSILLPCIIFVAFHSGSNKANNYKKNGKLTDCTVVSSIQVGTSGSVKVTYLDASGQTVTANVLGNRSAVSRSQGDHIQGYVLPDSPYEVFVPSGIGMRIFVYGVMAFFFLLGCSILLAFVIGSRRHGNIIQNGNFTEATMLRFTDIQHTAYGDICVGEFSFKTESGRQVTVELGVPKKAKVGTSYQIMYYEKPNGKCTVELMDYRLQS